MHFFSLSSSTLQPDSQPGRPELHICADWHWKQTEIWLLSPLLWCPHVLLHSQVRMCICGCEQSVFTLVLSTVQSLYTSKELKDSLKRYHIFFFSAEQKQVFVAKTKSLWYSSWPLINLLNSLVWILDVENCQAFKLKTRTILYRNPPPRLDNGQKMSQSKVSVIFKFFDPQNKNLYVCWYAVVLKWFQRN